MATSAPQAVRPATPAEPSAAAGPVAPWRPGLVLRDIALGGLAALPVGVLIGGVGARVAMRLAAIRVPAATGRLTENGNEIGEITLAGTVALVVFMGLFAGVAAAVVWVTARPWIPGRTRVRIVLAMPIAVALGSFAIIEGTNPDFAVLGHDPLVVALLVGVIALIGAGVAALDAWLDGRLPYPTSGASPSTAAYGMLAGLGGLLAALMIVPAYFVPALRPVGIALVVTGAATVAWWIQRTRGVEAPRAWTIIVGRTGLAAAVVIGFITLAPDLAVALAVD